MSWFSALMSHRSQQEIRKLQRKNGLLGSDSHWLPPGFGSLPSCRESADTEDANCPNGKLSLIRSGWIDVMVPMMVETLVGLRPHRNRRGFHLAAAHRPGNCVPDDRAYAPDQDVRRHPLDPLMYRRIYLDRLWDRIRDRLIVRKR